MKHFKKIALSVFLAFLIGYPAHAQNIEKKQKDSLVRVQKNQMKSEIKVINHNLSNGKIELEEADSLKREVAKKYADRIHKEWIKIQMGRETLKTQWSRKKKAFKKNVSSDLVIAIGLNNTIVEKQSIEDSPYKFLGSRFFELGWAWTRPFFKDSDIVHLRYGISIHYNGLKPSENQYFVKEGDKIVLEEFPHDLRKSKLLIKNVVFPVHLEFGPARGYAYRTETEDGLVKKTYKSTSNFRFGIGAYGGFNMGSHQKLKYKDGKRRKEKMKGNYLASSLVYGVSAYALFWDVAFYLKHDINPLFKNQPVPQRNVSLGVRFDIN